MTHSGPGKTVLIVRLHDPAKLLARSEGPAIRDSHASLFAALVTAAGGEVDRIELDSELDWTATFERAADALGVAVTLQQHPVGLEVEGPRLQTACGVFLENERAVRSYLFPRGSTGGRIVITEAAYGALPKPLQAAYEWLKPRTVRRRRWGRPWSVREEHDPRACFWDERFTLLNAPFERAFAVETTRWIGPRRASRKATPPTFPERPDTRNELVGLGLGGGGMRAAVFSLGVTQALARQHFLKDVDYIATVSGGGYLGASLQALMAEDLPYDEPKRFGTTRETFPFGFPRPADASSGTATSTGHAVHGVESPAVRYIREHARLLGRNIGVFDGYTWRIVGQVLLSMVLLWAFFLLPPIALLAIGGMKFRGWFADQDAGLQESLLISPVVVAVLAWLLTIVPIPLWRAGWVWLGRVLVLASVVVATLAVFAVVSTPSNKTAFNDAARVIAALSPILLFAVSAVAVLLFEALRSGSRKPSTKERWSETAQRTASYFALVASAVTAVLAVLFLVWVIEHTAYHGDYQPEARTTVAVIEVGGLVLTFSSIRSIVSGLAGTASGRIRALLPKLGLMVGGYLALGTTLAVSAWGLWWLWTHDEWAALWAIGSASGVCVILLGIGGRAGFWALNWFAPHRLYAGLIQESWLIGGKPARVEAEGGARVRQWFRVWNRPDLLISSLRSMDGRKLTAPYPLFCTTLNIPGTRDPRMPDRSCESFVIGPLTSGSALTRWTQTERYGPADGMPLATAAAISGAAVSPGLGFRTNRTYSVILTLFNVRLGQWLANPRPPDSGRAATWFNSMPVTLYWKEMLGLSNRDDRYIYLSDGEHFEGLGLYELLRRRCKYIIVVAADVEEGKDAPLKFGKLGGALRLARVDFGVEVEFCSLASLMRDEERPEFVGSYFAAGRIQYPSAAGHAKQQDETGILIVIKSGMVERTLPADILNYLRGSDPGFPNYPTQDLQYDQPQFESLRQLGYLAGEAMCKAGKTDATNLANETVAERFTRVLAAYEKLCSPTRGYEG